MFKQRDASNNILDLIIIISAIIIALIIYFQNNQANNIIAETSQPINPTRAIDKKEDLIFGNPNAQLFIVEYGDLECPFCKNLHPLIERFVQEKGLSGRVAWVWRHGPHINRLSIEKAETVECIKLVTNDIRDQVTWKFLSESLRGGILEREYPNERYEEIFKKLNIDSNKVNKCRKDNLVKDKLELVFNDVINLGIGETPLLHFVTSDGNLAYEIIGEIPISQLEIIVNTILASRFN